MVYKLVEINGVPKIKLSDEVEKTSLPGKKTVVRVFIEDSTEPAFDVICLPDENFEGYLNGTEVFKAWVPFIEESVEVKSSSIRVMTNLLIENGE